MLKGEFLVQLFHILSRSSYACILSTLNDEHNAMVRVSKKRLDTAAQTCRQPLYLAI
jgi:hypothetical protein